jgi:hypothetical protein
MSLADMASLLDGLFLFLGFSFLSSANVHEVRARRQLDCTQKLHEKIA